METLASRLASLEEELGFVGEWTDRYRLFVEWGEALEPLAPADRVDAWAVAGCSSPLWLRVRRVGGRLEVRGFSPGILPRALVAVVTRLFDGVTEASGSAAEILRVLGLHGHLSPTRTLVLERMLDRALDCGKPAGPETGA